MNTSALKIFFVSLFLNIGLTPNYTLKSQNVDTLVNALEHMSDYFLNRHQDTNYIGNYSNEFALKFQTLGKFNSFTLKDNSNQSRLKYIPVRDLRLGIGIAYKYFAFDMNIGLGLEKNSVIEDYRSFDFRARLYTSKQYLNTFLQYYQGYRISDFDNFSINTDNPQATRNDVRTIHFGLQYLYALNYTKFSLKAPFVFNELQRKTAGSFVFGANFNLLVIDGDSALIPVNIQPEFGDQLRVDDLNNLSLGISAGYMFTYVFKENFFATVSMIPGLIYNNGDYSVTTREAIPRQINGRIKSMNSLGYNARRFFTGVTFVAEGYWIKIAKNQRAEVSHGSASVFVGYRFKN
ncbi:MAG: hypothetical protein ACI9GM_000846 [Salibacteraceae bacterium]